MEDTSKYRIRAHVTADGVVERSDVVGAIFGQTEGLLGDELDLRDLRQSQKVGRIDVDITSTRGTSHGTLTIATSLDKVETATLAASLETIDRIGPCRASLEIDEIEDVRAAKRKDVVDRAKELLRTGFDDSVMSSEEILAEVREYVRVEDITEYEGLPAGPRVTDSDAIIVVEGRSDVLTLLKYGVKNGIAVEGTNVPDAVAELTHHRTVTAFLDGDRGGDLIFEELSQVGDIDYVTFAPAGTSVEELDHTQLFTALRNKVPYESVSDPGEARNVIAATDGSATPAPAPIAGRSSRSAESDAEDDPEESSAPPETPTLESASAAVVTDEDGTTASAVDGVTDREVDTAPSGDEVTPRHPESVYEHTTAVIGEGTEQLRLIDDSGAILEETDASEALELFEGIETGEHDAVDGDSEREGELTVVLDGILSQQLLDVATAAGIDRIVARALGQFTKRPTGVSVHAASDVADVAP